MANDKYTTSYSFYKNSYRLLSFITVFLLIVAGITLTIVFYSKVTRPTPAYFATTSDGRLIEIAPKK
jgi:hypothetical protein